MRGTLLFVSLFFYFFSGAQRIVNFELFQVNTTVSTKFTLRAGGTCYGYQILHSLDSVNFSVAVDYPTICGASGSDEYFSNVHESPVMNQFNFYKVQLSTFESSEVKKIFVSTNPGSVMFVYPNPAFAYSDVVRVKILNTSNLKLEGFIYDQLGVMKKEVSVETQGEIGVLDTSTLYNGIHIVWLTDGRQVFSAKFIISR